MNWRTASMLVALVMGTQAPGAVPQRNRPLRPSDFAVGWTLRLDGDSLSVIRQLGRPDSIRTLPEPFPDSPFTYWYFRDAVVTFETPNVVEGILLTTRTLSTARGLRVGDGRSRVRRTYGPPMDGSTTDQWIYWEEGRIPTRLVQVDFTGDRVSAILIRHVRA